MTQDLTGARAEYRFGRRRVRIASDDAAFHARFRELFVDCLDRNGPRGDALDACIDSSDPDWVRLRLALRPGALPDLAVIPALLPELELRPSPASSDERIDFIRAAQPVRVLCRASAQAIEFRRELPWQLLAGHFIVHQLLREQTDLVHLHAACVAIDGRGVLLCGDKCAGKSTLSLALAGRGHGFLGDEVTAIDPAAAACLAIPRAVSVRSGPQGTAAQRELQREARPHERLPDGTLRQRAPMSALFPAALRAQAPLAAAFFLEGFGAQPHAQPFAFSSTDLGRLQPLHASFAQRDVFRRALDLLRVFARLPCYRLTVGGTPDATAELIERTILEATWA